MNKEELLNRLKELYRREDIEHCINSLNSPSVLHEEADFLLLAFINDEEITKSFVKLERWYS